jgi:nitrile hydratase subunit beta
VNSIHDMGGMHGMGTIEPEEHEPVFHHRWEGRVYALSRVLRPRGGLWNLDANRYGIERFSPGDYLRMTYYERWLAWITATLVATGTATTAEIESGHPAPGVAKEKPSLTADAVPAMVAQRASARRNIMVAPRFTTGQKVRARNMHPAGHTRLPRYVRGKIGVVEVDRGVFVFPDTNAHLQGEKPQHLYSVRFAARELWGEAAASRDAVHLDLWDDYLQLP